MIECFVKTLKVISKSKLSLLQNILKSKEINSIIFTAKKLYAQASKINIKYIIHIKDIFLTLSPKKIVEINNIINKSSIVKLKIKITTKRPLRKQFITLISQNNSNIIRSNMSFHINDINKYLKDTNSNNSADFIHIDKVGIIVTIYITISDQDIRIIEKAIKNSKKINNNFVESP